MNPQYIILHCSATPDSETMSWDDIRHYHVYDNGWTDIGYHYGIEHYAGNLIVMQGRAPHLNGAHCRDGGMNAKSLGLCVVGEFDSKPPSDEVFIETIRFLAWLCFTFHISSFNVKPHREFNDNKTCPGKMWDMTKTRLGIDALLEFMPGVGTYMDANI